MNVYLTVVHVYDFFDQRQSQPGAAQAAIPRFIYFEKPLEYMDLIHFLNTAAIIDNLTNYEIIICFQGNVDSPLARS